MNVTFGSVFMAAVLLAVCAEAATNVKKCKKGPFPLSVDVVGCVEPPCDVVKGTNAEMRMHFVATKDNLRNLKAVVKATTAFITVPYDLPVELADVCSNLLYGAYCPLDETEDVVYVLLFPLDDSYPSIKVKVEIALVEDKETVACFSVDIKVRSGSTEQKLIS